MNDDDPPDEVLLELGRVTWVAIELEDATGFLCRIIKRHPEALIGRTIRQAHKDLKLWINHDIRDRADAWLVEATGALSERNSILHSSPGSYIGFDPDGAPHESDAHLAHLPIGQNRPAVFTPLSVEGLRPIRDRLRRARVGWVELASELGETRPGA